MDNYETPEVTYFSAQTLSSYSVTWSGGGSSGGGGGGTTQLTIYDRLKNFVNRIKDLEDLTEELLVEALELQLKVIQTVFVEVQKTYGNLITYKNAYRIFEVIISFVWPEKEILSASIRLFTKRYNAKHFDVYEGYIAYQGGTIKEGDNDDKKTLVKMNEMRLGITTFGNAGCEVIATYNALLYYDKWMDVRDIANDFEADGVILFGAFGSTPDAICRYLNKQGLTATLYTCEEIDDYDQYLNGGVGIITFWWEDSLDFENFQRSFMIHTVMLRTVGSKIYAYNMYSSEDKTPFLSVQEMISSKGIVPISLISVT